MKKILNYKLFTVFAVLLFSSISCTKDFTDINTDKNNPSTSQAAPDMLLTNTVESMTNRVHEIFLGEEMGSCWAQHQAKVQYTDEDRYQPRITVINNTWASFYAANGMDAATLIKVAKARGVNYDNYQGVGIVLKSYIASVLTDMFGPIPYSEAWRAGGDDGGIISPKYDTQRSIYLDIIDQLGRANKLMDASKPAIQGDILYGNDIAKWKKFANSLRLRLLLRMSDVEATMASDTMTEMLVTNAALYPIFESNADNAALVYLGSAPNNNPVNENRKTRDDHRVSKTLIDMMYTNNSLVDWRVTAYANLATASSDFVGLPNGLPSADATAYLGNGLTQTSKLGDYFTDATAPGMLMSYAELQFILAEGVQRGFIAGAPSTAQQYYVAGVNASYSQFGNVIAPKVLSIWGAANCNAWFGTPIAVPPAVQQVPTIASIAANYLANDGAWVIGSELERIATERWLATFDQGLQSTFEWRRTGYPQLDPPVGAFNAQVPVRAYYPSDEFSRNSAQVKAGVVLLGGADDLNTRVWWDVADNF